MKTKQAWGWLAAGVLALGLNGFYQDGGAVWAHRAVDQIIAGMSDRTEGVLALATGHADRFMATAERVAARDETTSCRLAPAMARMQTRIAGAQAGFAGFEAMSAREEAQMARFEADRARIDAQIARVRFAPVAFGTVKIPAFCPRVNVRVPQISVPRITVPQVPMVRIPDIHLETIGAGPV
jgi:hypothetical protein